MSIVDSALFRFGHCALAFHTQGFGIHSPFLYEFVQQVACNKHPYYCFNRLDVVLRRCSHQRDVRLIAKNLQLLFRIAVYMKARCIIDMGMASPCVPGCLGMARPNARCFSWQTDMSRLEETQRACNDMDVHTVSFVQGNEPDVVYSELLRLEVFPDMVCFGTGLSAERLNASVDLLLTHVSGGRTVILFEHIHRSATMRRVWHRVCRHDCVTAAIDMQRIGVAFVRPNLRKKVYYVRPK